ncbi:MAG: TlpA family protein disulfide reductase [Rhodothermaceae bacterium]|nr:TlpA family protein disulfide reductase [Rhodothermaceae bacterium]
MTNIISYGLGLLLGATITLILGIYMDVYPAKMVYDYLRNKDLQTLSAPKGDIPDFSIVPPAVNVFDRIDADWNLLAPDQGKIPFHDFKGKVLFLSRWATWCAPCIAEMPEIARLKEQLDSDEFVIMLYTDEQEYLVRSFKNEHNVPIYISDGNLPEVLHARSLPQSMVVDKNGVVRYVHSGVAAWGDEAVVDYLKMIASE